MKKRNRSKPEGSLQDRLLAFARAQRDRAKTMPKGAERDALLMKAHQADSTAQTEFVSSRPSYPMIE